MAASDPRDSDPGGKPVVTQKISAQAAVWITRLHGPDRSVEMEQQFLAWQARSAAHRLAFERCTEVWEAVRRLDLADVDASAPDLETEAGTPAQQRGRWSRHARWMLLLAVALALALGGLWLVFWENGGVFSTQGGELQATASEDGARLSRNTDTRVRVETGPKR